MSIHLLEIFESVSHGVASATRIQHSGLNLSNTHVTDLACKAPFTSNIECNPIKSGVPSDFYTRIRDVDQTTFRSGRLKAPHSGLIAILAPKGASTQLAKAGGVLKARSCSYTVRCLL